MRDLIERDLMAKFSVTQVRSDNKKAISRIKARLDGLSSKALEQAIGRTLIGAKRRFEPAAKRVIRSVYNVKAGNLAGQFQVQTTADVDGEYVVLAANTDPIPLIQFGGKWGGRKTAGATAEIQRGARKIYTSAFIAMINGKQRLVARQFKGDGSGKRYARNELRSLTGPSPSQMVEGNDLANSQAIATEVNGYIDKELARQIALARKIG